MTAGPTTRGSPDPHMRPGLLGRVLLAVLTLFNIAAAVLLVVAWMDLQTATDPGAAIGMAMILIYALAGNLVLGGLVLVLWLLRRGRRG